MVPEGKCDWNLMKDREIHGESNVLITAQGRKNICGFDVNVGLV